MKKTFTPVLIPAQRLALAIACLILSVAAQAQPVRKQFVETNGSVQTIVKDGNTLYLGGSFSQAGYRALRGAVVSPTNDFPAPNFPDANGTINSVLADGAGGWYVGGTFSMLGQVSVNRLAHILPDMTVDPAFRPEPNNAVYAMQMEGAQLYVGGAFTNIGGSALNRLAMIDAATGLAGSWNPNANQNVNGLLIDGGVVYVTGNFTLMGTTEVSYIAKLDKATGNVLRFTTVDGVPTLVRKNANTLYFGGSFIGGGYQTNRLAGYTGSSDVPDFDFPRADGAITAVLPDGAGGWYVGGNFSVIGGMSRIHLAHILADHTIDGNFAPGANGGISQMQKVGNLLYVVGSFTNIGGSNQNRAACIDLSSGQLTNWNPNPNNAVNSIYVSGTDALLGGYFSKIGDVIQNNLARVDLTTGALLNSPAVNSTVNAIVVDGTTAYLGGSFTQSGFNTGYGALVSTASDKPVFAFPKTDNPIYAAEADGAGGWYVGGSFGTIGGQSIARLAHVLADNTVDPTFSPNPNSTVATLKLSGTSLYVGGSFTTIGSNTQSNLAVINTATGAVDAAWTPNPNGSVTSIEVDGNTVYFSGSFYDGRHNQPQLRRRRRQGQRHGNGLEPQPEQLLLPPARERQPGIHRRQL